MQESQKEYIEKMIETYSDMVYRLALSRVKNKENAEDIFQEVFLKLSNKLPEFRDKEHEKAWLIRVTINCSKNFFRSAWNQKVETIEQEITFQTQERNEIYDEIMQMPIKERTILYLFYYEGYSLKEIASIMKISMKNAKTKLFRARQKLKEKMIGGFEDE